MGVPERPDPPPPTKVRPCFPREKLEERPPCLPDKLKHSKRVKDWLVPEGKTKRKTTQNLGKWRVREMISANETDEADSTEFECRDPASVNLYIPSVNTIP